jgi:hypothetical protein
MRKCFYVVICLLLLSCSGKKETSNILVYSDPTMPLIQLPVNFKTYRQNTNTRIDAGGYCDIINVKGPGCVRSIWMLKAEGKRIEIVTDGEEKAQVNMSAPSFFGTLLGKDPYFIDSAPIVSMPNEYVKNKFGGGEPGYTFYMPIPFQDSCRIRIYADKTDDIAAMVNWHKYGDEVKITPYRFNVSHKIMNPAPPRGSQLCMADISGSGFIAGIFMGVEQLSFDDLMYHQGGITWFIDGETDPHAIRGHNMEDDYGFTWGFHKKQTAWFGVPYHEIKPLENTGEENSIFSYSQKAVVYRFMGPDPISFESSISVKVGTRPDFTETVLYYYKKQDARIIKSNTPDKWQVTGPLPCKTKEDFEKNINPSLLNEWHDSVNIDGNKYCVYEVDPDHTWVNLHPLFFTSMYTPFPLTDQLVFAKGFIESNKEKQVVIRLAFDDWMAVWLNGEKISNYYNDEGFSTVEVAVKLKKGSNYIILEYANFNNLPNNRLWAFSMSI